MLSGEQGPVRNGVPILFHFGVLRFGTSSKSRTQKQAKTLQSNPCVKLLKPAQKHPWMLSVYSHKGSPKNGIW